MYTCNTLVGVATVIPFLAYLETTDWLGCSEEERLSLVGPRHVIGAAVDHQQRSLEQWLLWRL